MQLRALLRASAFGDVKIMIPLVTCVEEVRAVKALVKSLWQSWMQRAGNTTRTLKSVS